MSIPSTTSSSESTVGCGIVSQHENGRRVTLFIPEHNGSTDGATVEIYAFGAHVTKWYESYRQHSNLFLSNEAKLDGTKAIRGGIPLIFPQFGPLGPLKQHGLVRDVVWTIAKQATSRGEASITFTLHSNEAMETKFAHPFELTYTICLSGARHSSLTCVWRINNLSSHTAMPFTCALHTYFAVGDIDGVQVDNLAGLSYIDNLRDDEVFVQSESSLIITANIDRVYINVSSPIHVKDTHNSRTFIITNNQYLRDVVVWNPWAHKAQSMSDFGDEEYKRMVCVEAGAIATPLNVAPNDCVELNMSIRCVYDDDDDDE